MVFERLNTSAKVEDDDGNRDRHRAKGTDGMRKEGEIEREEMNWIKKGPSL